MNVVETALDPPSLLIDTNPGGRGTNTPPLGKGATAANGMTGVVA